jgi:nitrogen fixation/metabolism regulation signal transduction histidine kinase
MIENYISTKYAPAKREIQIELERQCKIFSQNNLLTKLLKSLSQMLVVLNKQRQIIYANQLYYEFCGVPENESLLGKRPGEVLNCRHAFLKHLACGTTEFCKKCGATNAIIESHDGIQSTKECRITTQTHSAIDIQVTASPYHIKGEIFTIFALLDISNKKRKETLERVFFHDILNSAVGISGLSAILKDENSLEEINDIGNIIHRAADNLVEEIQMQRQLYHADSGELTPEFKDVNSLSILKDLKDVYVRHDLISDKTITICEHSDNVILNTDPVLLRRVLGNMLKNALEVYNPMAEITLNCISQGKSVQFSVHNPTYINRDIQLQLFNRSFSTKGTDRGIGTYSMKLFGEKYLKGKVWFNSTIKEGTTFFIQV